MTENEETCYKITRNINNITAQQSKQFGLEITVETKKLQIGQIIQDGTIVNAMVTLKANSKINSSNNLDNPNNQPRGTSYTIMLDRSESMLQYNKMDNAKKAVKQLLESLAPNDRFSLIPFGGSNKVLIPFTDINSSNQESVIETLNNVKCEGRTDIVSVINTAIKTIQQEQNYQQRLQQKQEFSTQNKKNKKNINVDEIESIEQQIDYQEPTKKPIKREYCVILLSDGEDNIRQGKALYEIREILKNENLNYSINCFGFGIDHDGNLLSGIAELTGGQYYYIKENEDIYDYLKECQGSYGNIQFTNVEVTFESIGQQIINHAQNQKINISLVDLPSKSIEISKNNIYKIHFQQIQNNTEKKIIFSFQLNKCDSQNNSTPLSNQPNSLDQSFCSISSQLSLIQSQSDSSIDLKSIQKLDLGLIKVSFCRKEDINNYENVEIPISININNKQEYNLNVLKETTVRIFSNQLQKSIYQSFSGKQQLQSGSYQKLEQIQQGIQSYDSYKIEVFSKISELIKFFLYHLQSNIIKTSPIYQKELQNLTQEIVFYYKYNQQQSQKISQKIEDVIKKQEEYFKNDLTNLLVNTTFPRREKVNQ